MVIYLEQGADCLHMVNLMLLPSKPHHCMHHLNPHGSDIPGNGFPRLSWKRGR